MDNLPQWVHAIVEDVKSSPQNQIGNLIRVKFAERKLKPSTMVNYISQLQTILLKNGVLTKKLSKQDFQCNSELEQKTISKILELNPLKLYRLWQRLQKRRETPNHIYKQLKDMDIRLEFLQNNKFNADLIEEGTCDFVQQKQSFVQQNPIIITINSGNFFLKRILEGFKTNTLGGLFCALALSCGRRASTIFLHPDSFFHNAEKMNSRVCRYEEKLKVRDSKKKGDIPLLVPFDIFKKKLDVFQSLLPIPVSTPIEVNKVYEKDIIKWVEFSSPIPIQPHMFRAIYARTMFDIIQDRSLHPLYFIRNVLLHDSINSSVSYDKVQIVWEDDPEVTIQEIIGEIREIEENLK